MKEVYFHEDDYCQIELAPIENEEFIKQEIDAINGFFEEHKVPNGIGWTEMYMRKEPQRTLKDLKISIKEFDENIGNLIGKYDIVYSGYSTYREECKSTNGYGDDQVKFFIEHNEGIITNFWFDFLLADEDTAIKLNDILKLITNHYDLLFVHWPWGFYSRPKRDDNLLKTLKDTSNELKIKLDEVNNSKNNKRKKKWWEFWK